MLIRAGDMCSTVDTRRYEVTHFFTVISSGLAETMVDISYQYEHVYSAA